MNNTPVTTTIDGFEFPNHISFLVRDEEVINANAACHTHLSEAADKGRLQYHEQVDKCTTRGQDDDKIESCRQLIIKSLHLKEDEWEVVFTSNATDSLNIATALIYNYTRAQKDIAYNYYVHTLSHNSLYLPTQKQAGLHNLDVQTFVGLDKAMLNNSVISMPYIDNLLGINLYQSFFGVENCKLLDISSMKQTKPIGNTHIILDCAQAGLTMFNPYPNKFKDSSIRRKILPRLDMVSAIALSAHKFHGPHLGVLLIRKEYTNQDLFIIPEIKVGGGAVESIDGVQSKLLKNYNGLEAGLINSESIYGLYFWLLTLSVSETDLWAIPKENAFWLKNKITQELSSTFKVIDKNNYLSGVELISSGNIILLETINILASDVLIKLSQNNIDARCGSFCCDLAIDQLGLSTNLLRLSFDYTFTQKNAEKLFTILSEMK